MISDGKARRIASEWHSGQASALYALASSGAIVSGAMSEAEENIRVLMDVPDALDEYRELNELQLYISRNGTRGPVEGWSELWED